MLGRTHTPLSPHTAAVWPSLSTLELPDLWSATCVFEYWTIIFSSCNYFFIALWYPRSKRQLWILPLLFIQTLHAFVCLNLRSVLTTFILCACAHACASIPCWSLPLPIMPGQLVKQTNWTLGVKHAWAWYILPDVSASSVTNCQKEWSSPMHFLSAL